MISYRKTGAFRAATEVSRTSLNLRGSLGELNRVLNRESPTRHASRCRASGSNGTIGISAVVQQRGVELDCTEGVGLGDDSALGGVALEDTGGHPWRRAD